MANKLKFCPMLTGKEEVKALTIGQGDCVIPTLHVCLQEHCVAYVKTLDGRGKCSHYHYSFVDYEEEE